MKFFILILLAAAAGASGNHSQTIRALDLKAQPSADAASVAPLAVNTRVEILQRQGAWFQVKATNNTGWLRMLAVRPESTGGKSGGGLVALGHLVGGGSGNSAVATGVRGLNDEDLKNAKANPAELEKLTAQSAEPDAARHFAGEAGLAAKTIDYLPVAVAKPEAGAK